MGLLRLHERVITQWDQPGDLRSPSARPRRPRRVGCPPYSSGPAAGTDGRSIESKPPQSRPSGDGSARRRLHHPSSKQQKLTEDMMDEGQLFSHDLGPRSSAMRKVMALPDQSELYAQIRRRAPRETIAWLLVPEENAPRRRIGKGRARMVPCRRRPRGGDSRHLRIANMMRGAGSMRCGTGGSAGCRSCSSARKS